MGKSKKPTFLTYDLIRQNKFRSPEKILTVEKMLETNDCVINWWCRQSGKTLTNIKVARDLVMKEKNNVLIVCPKAAMIEHKKEVLARCIDRNLVESDDKNGIKLKNGNEVRLMVANMPGLKDFILDKKINLVIFDDFEWIDQVKFSAMLRDLKSIYEPSIWEKFINMFDANRKRKPKMLLSSSMNNKKNFDLIRKIFPESAVTYLNWEKVSFGPGKIDEMKRILSEKEFETEYNSYFP